MLAQRLFLLALAGIAKGNPFFAGFDLSNEYSSVVDQCQEVQVEIGGGIPPYSVNLWSQDEQRFTSQVLIGEAGYAIWRVRYPPYSRWTLYTVDATSAYVQARHFRVHPSTHTRCDISTPEFRRAYQLEVQFQPRQEELTPHVAPRKRQSCPPGGCTTYTDIPIETVAVAQVPSAGATAPPVVVRANVPPASPPPEPISTKTTSTPSGSAEPTFATGTVQLSSFQSSTLSACDNDGSVTCEFFPGNNVGAETQVQTQATPIGDPFDNCGGTTAVKQVLGGVVTVTDSWSEVDDSGGQLLFSQPIPIGVIKVEDSPKNSLAVQIGSNYELNVPPAKQTALVAVLSYNGIYGYVKMKHEDGSEKIIDVVYFQGSGQRPKVQLQTLECGRNWPAWNATPWNATAEQEKTGGAVHYHYQPPWLYLVLMTIMFVLW